jgi:Glycine zipper
MKRALAVLTAVIALQTLAACSTLAGAAIGGGIGYTQGHTAAGTAIGAGVGSIVGNRKDE